MKHIVLFASGQGTNAENIIRYFQNSASANVSAVFSNNPEAGVLAKAVAHKVPVMIFTKEQLNDGIVLQKLNSFQPDLIVLAGFLLKFPDNIICHFPDKIINIHPALLPKYGGKGMYGMNVHNAVFNNKETETGISVHYVNEQYDKGVLIFQKNIAVDTCSSPEEIAAKIHKLEQKHFPEVIEKILNLNP